MFRKAKGNRVSDNIVHQIREVILNGELSVGEKLPSQRNLQKLFGVSIGTIRESLRVLEQQGIIEIKFGSRGGSVVKAPDTKQVSDSLALLIRSQKASLADLAEFREELEGAVARLAAERATKIDIERLQKLCRDARHCLDAGRSRRLDYIELERQIHLALADITNNLVYVSVIRTIQENIRQAYAEYYPTKDRIYLEAQKGIEEIIDAIKKKHGNKAEQLARDHVRRATVYMQDNMEKRRSG